MTGSSPPPFWSDTNLNQPNQPVVGVSWHEATSYCAWLKTVTGKNFRLPTEAEWERAARGDREGALFPWGDEPPQSRPDYSGALAKWAGSRWRWRAQCLRASQHVRQRTRMVQRLVLARLLRGVSRAESARAGDRPAACVSRRIVAPPHQDVALRSTIEYSAGISICGLRVQGGERSTIADQTRKDQMLEVRLQR